MVDAEDMILIANQQRAFSADEANTRHVFVDVYLGQ